MARLGGYAYWNERAHLFDEATRRIVAEDTERLIDAWLLQRVTKDDEVLDLGCGTGRYADVLAPAVRRVIATDMAPRMLAEAEKKLQRHPNVSVQKADCYHCPFSAESFDVVVAGNLLHIVEAPKQVVREASRLLRPGGRLFAVDYTATGMRPLAVAKMLVAVLRNWGLPSRDNRNMSPAQIEALANGLDLEVRRCQLVGAGVKAVCLEARRPPREVSAGGGAS